MWPCGFCLSRVPATVPQWGSRPDSRGQGSRYSSSSVDLANPGKTIYIKIPLAELPGTGDNYRLGKCPRARTEASHLSPVTLAQRSASSLETGRRTPLIYFLIQAPPLGQTVPTLRQSQAKRVVRALRWSLRGGGGAGPGQGQTEDTTKSHQLS